MGIRVGEEGGSADERMRRAARQGDLPGCAGPVVAETRGEHGGLRPTPAVVAGGARFSAGPGMSDGIDP
jgi:hypothetical protein